MRPAPITAQMTRNIGRSAQGRIVTPLMRLQDPDYSQDHPGHPARDDARVGSGRAAGGSAPGAGSSPMPGSSTAACSAAGPMTRCSSRARRRAGADRACRPRPGASALPAALAADPPDGLAGPGQAGVLGQGSARYRRSAQVEPLALEDDQDQFRHLVAAVYLAEQRTSHWLQGSPHDERHLPRSARRLA